MQSVRLINFITGFVKSVKLFVKSEMLSEMLFERPSSLSVVSAPSLQLLVLLTIQSLLSSTPSSGSEVVFVILITVLYFASNCSLTCSA
jgi:hypothetical protein